MRNVTRAFVLFLIGTLAILAQPVLVQAFVLIELVITVTLAPGEEGSGSFDDIGLPNTGFTTVNLDPAATLEVEAGYGRQAGTNEEFLPEEEVQDGFVLLDGTLALEVAASDSQNAPVRALTTYRFDVASESLGRDFIARALVRQGIVRDQVRARARARAMGLADARVMRLTEIRAGEVRWVRAVRAIRAGGRADIRFTPRMAPDGQLGHFGNSTTAEGDLYVWAVVDRNSEYAVGLTIDRDSDGVPNSEDNCIGAVNSNQADLDADGYGDECDADDDGDGIADSADNCPLAHNPGQEDYDSDGFGDACDEDSDGDGVNDGEDACLGTEPGETVDLDGCSIADHCPCEGSWRNHGAYVRCVAGTSEAFVEFGLISEEEKDAIVSSGARSECGF